MKDLLISFAIFDVLYLLYWYFGIQRTADDSDSSLASAMALFYGGGILLGGEVVFALVFAIIQHFAK